MTCLNSWLWFPLVLRCEVSTVMFYLMCGLCVCLVIASLVYVFSCSFSVFPMIETIDACRLLNAGVEGNTSGMEVMLLFVSLLAIRLRMKVA